MSLFQFKVFNGFGQNTTLQSRLGNEFSNPIYLKCNKNLVIENNWSNISVQNVNERWNIYHNQSLLILLIPFTGGKSFTLMTYSDVYSIEINTWFKF